MGSGSNMIQELIDEYLAEEQSKRRKHSGKFASSRLGRCYRFQYWKREGKEGASVDARTLRVFRCGNMFHEFVQDTIVRMYPEAEIEVKFEVEDVIGYADVVLPDEVIEAKSQHSRAFWYLKKGNKSIEEAKYANCIQLMSYCYFLEKPKGRLVFISKDDLTIAEYPLDFTDAWHERIANELTILRHYWAKKELPPAVPRAYGGKECKYCPYTIICKEVENGRTESL